MKIFPENLSLYHTILGLVESPIMPLTASLLIAEILDDVRAQLGVHYPQDQGLVRINHNHLNFFGR